MKTHLLICIKLTLVTAIIFGILYPLAITGIAMLVAPNGGRGEAIVVNGRMVGFELIGQKFDDDKYFNTRPSAVDYNAAATGGSNKGPTNPEYLDQVKARIDTFRAHNPGVKNQLIPVDLVTASGSGLDPHISPAAARIQIERISSIRHIDTAKLEALVNGAIEKPILGMGMERIHVLKLNVALDNLK